MGLFDLFRKPQTIQDDFFGTMLFISFKDATKNYFEGKCIFKPTGDKVELLIRGDAGGPTQEQRQLYARIQDSYDEIVIRIVPLIERELKEWREDNKIRDFRKEFKPASVTIPRIAGTPIRWDMTFEAIHEDEHQVTVDFKDFEPEKVLIDG